MTVNISLPAPTSIGSLIDRINRVKLTISDVEKLLKGAVDDKVIASYETHRSHNGWRVNIQVIVPNLGTTILVVTRSYPTRSR